MAKLQTAIRGTQDVLPKDSYKWQYVEKTLLETAGIKAEELCAALRREGFAAITDLNGRGLKAQMKYAGKLNARYVIVLGDNELAEGKAKLKNMDTSEQRDINIADIVKEFYSHSLDDSFAAMEQSVENM